MSLSQVQQDPRAFLKQLFQSAVESALPQLRMVEHLPLPPKGRTLVLGAGKAGGAMVHALEALWPQDSPISGLVVTRYGHIPERPVHLKKRIELVEASHPVPDEAGMKAAQRILELTQGLTKDDLVLCLISGGGSALLTLPAEGLSLADKQNINRALLASGASISEINTVRKHLSRIKGGRLAKACSPARVVTITISDVLGDDPAVIASGPTVPDASTCDQAISILKRYNIALPNAVADQLKKGLLETPKPDESCFASHAVHLIATPQQSLQVAARLAQSHGLHSYILSDEIEGESREVGKMHAALARASAKGQGPFIKPCVILSGGETTVTIRPQEKSTPPGRGGRAGEFCLGLAMALQSQAHVWAVAADTDGIDGIEDNAGAIVSPDVLQRALQLNMSPSVYLDRNDSHSFFSHLNDLVITGPTHTNVNDFRAILIL